MLDACHYIWLENSIGIAAFIWLQSKLYEQHIMKSTFKTGLIAEIVQTITHEMIMEKEIVDLNTLFLNLSKIIQVLFTIFGYQCILRLECQVHCSWSVQRYGPTSGI